MPSYQNNLVCRKRASEIVPSLTVSSLYVQRAGRETLSFNWLTRESCLLCRSQEFPHTHVIMSHIITLYICFICCMSGGRGLGVGTPNKLHKEGKTLSVCAQTYLILVLARGLRAGRISDLRRAIMGVLSATFKKAQ